MKYYPTLTRIQVEVGSLSGGWNHIAPTPYEMWIERNKLVDIKVLDCEGIRI